MSFQLTLSVNHAQTISITRDTVKLEDQSAKKEIIGSAITKEKARRCY